MPYNSGGKGCSKSTVIDIYPSFKNIFFEQCSKVSHLSMCGVHLSFHAWWSCYCMPVEMMYTYVGTIIDGMSSLWPCVCVCVALVS